MSAWLDGNKIIDTKVNNKDVYNLKVLSDKFASDYKPEDFQSLQANYKAVGHCFCVLVTNITDGTHELRYKTIIEGTGGIAEGKGWDQETDVTYKLNVSK